MCFQPRFQNRISSTRSWNQNTGPTLATNRLKLFVIIGNDSGSFDVSKVVFSFLREFAVVGEVTGVPLLFAAGGTEVVAGIEPMNI